MLQPGVQATPLCARLGIEVPVIQAPIGSAATPELAAAVADAGGLGMLALTWHTRQQAAAQISRVRELTVRRVGVNLVLAFPIEDVLAECLDRGISIISTFWGDPNITPGNPSNWSRVSLRHGRSSRRSRRMRRVTYQRRPYWRCCSDLIRNDFGSESPRT